MKEEYPDYPRLRAAAAAAREDPDDPLLPRVFLEFKNPAYEDALLNNLKVVVAEIQQGTYMAPSNVPPLPTSATTTGDHEKAWEFSDQLFHALNCSCAPEKLEIPDRRALLRLEMWKAKESDGSRKSSLLIKDGGRWYKLLIMAARYEDQHPLLVELEIRERFTS